MCWSGEASGVLAAIGIGTTLYAAAKKEVPALWLALGYFSLMELLQAVTYIVIDLCGLPMNQVLTLLGFLHICFQPFFANALSMYFIPQNVARKIAPGVYALCFVSAIAMLIQLYPLQDVGMCVPGGVLCGPQLCSVSGTWHIAWLIPYNGLLRFGDLVFPTYVLTVFLLPVLYGSWRMTVYHLLFGPLLALATTQNFNEWPAVWCLLSIGILLVVVKTPLRGILFVRWWPLWRLVGEPAVGQAVVDAPPPIPKPAAGLAA